MRMLIDDIVDFCFSILNSTEIKTKKWVYSQHKLIFY